MDEAAKCAVEGCGREAVTFRDERPVCAKHYFEPKASKKKEPPRHADG